MYIHIYIVTLLYIFVLFYLQYVLHRCEHDDDDDDDDDDVLGMNCPGI